MPGFAKQDSQPEFDAAAGDILRQARELRGIGQEEMSLRLGISKGALSHMENGRTSISLWQMARAAKFLDVSLRFLLDDLEVPGAPLRDWAALTRDPEGDAA